MVPGDSGFLPSKMYGSFPESTGAPKCFKVLPQMSPGGSPEYSGCWNIRGGVALSPP
jgi:hypothetical protein